MISKLEPRDPVSILTEIALRALPNGKLRTAIGEWYWERSFKKLDKKYGKNEQDG